MADKKSQKASIVDRPLSKGRGEVRHFVCVENKKFV